MLALGFCTLEQFRVVVLLLGVNCSVWSSHGTFEQPTASPQVQLEPSEGIGVLKHRDISLNATPLPETKP